jgi:aldehyde dehydrogenase
VCIGVPTEEHMNKVDMQSVLKAPFAKRYGNFIGGEWR